MNQEINIHIQSLSGYLLCLSRLCGANYSFYASSYLAEAEPAIFLKNLLANWNEIQSETNYSLNEICKIEYEDLISEISKYIFNGILKADNLAKFGSSEYIGRMLTEDITEYYGLASTGLNKHGVFHPLIGSNVYRAYIESNEFKESLYFIVKIENMFVLTHFGIRENST